MKNIGKLISLLLLVLVGFVSCSETDESSVYANWALKNTQYIDSIAAEADANTSGEWKRFLRTGLDPEVEWSNYSYVYCKVKSSGAGTLHPASNSSVWINYSGRLIDGFVFDNSYSGELNPDYDEPVEVALNTCVEGFSIALQQMVEGDIWEVFIPANLGYGAYDYNQVKGASTLIFTINLVDFSYPQKDN